MEELQPKPVRLAWSRSHGEPMETLTFPVHSADPPAPGGVGVNSAGATATADGGVSSGFTHRPQRLREHDQSVWDAMAAPDDAGQPMWLADMVVALRESPIFRSSARLQTLRRARLILSRLSADSECRTPVTIPASDLAVLVEAALQRLR